MLRHFIKLRLKIWNLIFSLMIKIMMIKYKNYIEKLKIIKKKKNYLKKIDM
jgi:hypothetical protein